MPSLRPRVPPLAARSAVLLGLALAASLALMPLGSTQAALWFEITVAPEAPRAEETTIVRVQTFSFVQTTCIDDPEANPTPAVAYTGDTYPTVLDTFEVTATAPDGEEHLVLLKRTKEDGSIWEGKTVFPEPGEWALEMTMPYAPHAPVPDPCSGSSIIVTVRASDHATPVATPVASPVS